MVGASGDARFVADGAAANVWFIMVCASGGARLVMGGAPGYARFVIDGAAENAWLVVMGALSHTVRVINFCWG